MRTIYNPQHAPGIRAYDKPLYSLACLHGSVDDPLEFTLTGTLTLFLYRRAQALLDMFSKTSQKQYPFLNRKLSFPLQSRPVSKEKQIFCCKKQYFFRFHILRGPHPRCKAIYIIGEPEILNENLPFRLCLKFPRGRCQL